MLFTWRVLRITTARVSQVSNMSNIWKPSKERTPNHATPCSIMQHHATQQEEAAECCGHCVFEHDRLISILVGQSNSGVCRLDSAKSKNFGFMPGHQGIAGPCRTKQQYQQWISNFIATYWRHPAISARGVPVIQLGTWRMKPKLRMHDTAGSLLQSREQACLQPHVKVTRCYKIILQHACCTYLSIFGKP